MLKRILWILLLAAPFAVHAQTASLPVYDCVQHGTPALVSGLKSTNQLQGIIPSCTVSVYLTGTQTIATTSPQSPFTANTNGSIPPIFATVNQGYDVVLSGGIPPNVYVQPVTLTGLYPGANITIPTAGCVGQNSVANGCTGATTEQGANGSLGIPGPVFNATDYGAVGDSTTSASTTTDNCTPLQNTINAAAAVGGSVFLPTYLANAGQPTVYYTSCTLSPKGVSIFSNPGNGGYGFYAKVNIRGAPGKDVFATGDPTSGGYVSAGGGFVWQDFGIIIDDSTDVSATIASGHRKPGKTCSDVTVTNASPVITSTECAFNQGDVGQNISVTNGTNTLTTTIASVPVNSQQEINTAVLSANWTFSSGSDETAYVAIMGQSIAQRVGNSALAYDNTSTTSVSAPLSAVFRNMTIVTTSQAMQNNVGAFFFQGTQPYAVTWDNLFIRTDWGLVATVQDGLPAADKSSLAGYGDTNLWQNVFLESVWPWVSFNGGFNRWYGGQIATGTATGYGPQFLQVNGLEDSTTGWDIRNVEFEGPGTGGGGWRISGSWQNIFGGNIVIENTIPSQWDAVASRCTLCGDGNGNLNLTGSLNDIEFAQAPFPALNDTGFRNKCSILRSGNPLDGQEPAIPQSCSAVNSRQTNAFTHDSSFVANGDEQTPYNNQSDLLVWPQDMYSLTGLNLAPQVVADSTSQTGAYLQLPSGGLYFGSLNGITTVIGPSNTGANLPATENHFCFNAKTLSGSTSVFFSLYANNVQIASINPTLTSSYASYCFDANLESYTGQAVTFSAGNSGAVAALAFISVHPWSGNINSTGIVNAAGFNLSGSPLTTGNLADWTNSGVANGDVPVWNSSTGQWTPGAGGGGAFTSFIAGTNVTLTGSGCSGGTCTSGDVTVTASATAATAFSAITGSTNNSGQAMVVGSTSSLDYSGTGTIDANEVNGAAVAASAGFLASNSSRQLVAAAYTPANCTAGTTGSDCLQLSSGLVPVGNIPTGIPIGNVGSAGLSGTAPVAISAAGAISMHVADASDNGYLSSTDWSTFNGKQAALSLAQGTYVDGDYCTYAASGTLLNCNSTPGGGGTVTSFSAGNLSPLFTTSVATATSTPALTFSLSNAAQNSVLAGPASGGAGAPSYQTAPTISAANMTSFPTLNQNTTGSAAKWTTARNLAGNSVDGSANVAFANKVILQGTTDAGFSSAQFLGALGTGIVKNTTTTGVLSIAAASDVYGLWSGSCSSSTYLRGDGACATPSGSSGLSGMTTGQVPIAATASTVTSSEALAGTGAAIVTGPASSTSGDAVIYTGTSGQTADAGYVPAAALGNVTDETSGWSLVANNFYRFTGSGASNATTPATTGATGLSSFSNAGTATVTVVTGGPTLVCVPSSCAVPVGASVLVNSDGTDQYATISNANGSAFGTAANDNTGTSGATIPLLNGTNTWSGVQTFGTNISIGGQTLSGGVQGTGDTKALLAGTVSGTSALLCTDANGGATTSSCPSGGNASGYLGAATAIGSAGSTQSFTCASTLGSVQTMTLSTNLTISFTQSAGNACLLRLIIKQAAGGGDTVTWTSVKWPAGVVPVMTAAANAVDVYSCLLDGTNTECTAGQNIQ